MLQAHERCKLVNAAVRNLIPGRYRGVSVAQVDVALTQSDLSSYFQGLEAYFKTRFVVARNGSQTAVLSLTKAESSELFSPISEVRLLAGPADTAFVHAPEVDTGIPSALAAVARTQAPDKLAVVVHGRYEHINFIIGADPLRILVREVTPPEPAKLLDQARRILAVREDLPPIELVPDIVDLTTLARENPAEDYLLPCRGSGFVPEHGRVHYLDEHPAKADWVMLGCTRSRQIHHYFYNTDAPSSSFCPLERPPSDETVLTKCCMQDDELRCEDNWVSVPWGSSLERVAEALDALVRLKEPRWQPA